MTGKWIRTTNILELIVKDVRRRANVIGRFPNKVSALSLVFGVLAKDRLKLRGLKNEK